MDEDEHLLAEKESNQSMTISIAERNNFRSNNQALLEENSIRATSPQKCVNCDESNQLEKSNLKNLEN